MPTINKASRPWYNKGAKKDYRRKPKSDNFYSNQPWRKKRLRILIANPLCVHCLKEGKTVAATIVDHDKPRRFYPELELEDSNLNGLCNPCHERKSAKESRIKSKEEYEQSRD